MCKHTSQLPRHLQRLLNLPNSPKYQLKGRNAYSKGHIILFTIKVRCHAQNFTSAWHIYRKARWEVMIPCQYHVKFESDLTQPKASSRGKSGYGPYKGTLPFPQRMWDSTKCIINCKCNEILYDNAKSSIWWSLTAILVGLKKCFWVYAIWYIVHD